MEEVKSEVPVPAVPKSLWKSKTVWVNIFAGVAIGISSFSPSASEFIKTYFAEAGVVWTFLNIILRAITKDKVYLY